MQATLLRAGLSAVEPFYAAAAAGRNWLFETGLKSTHRLTSPVISVGNITTGGTGKTPAVRWLAARLRDQGRRVAVLARGYGARPGELGDEQQMLERLLNEGHTGNPVTIVANPDRVGAATRVLRDRPDVDAFILDDGFQHRRIARDLDLVLVSAITPFGYDHVLPRGMLREPIGGLRRADAIVVTHADQGPDCELEAIDQRIRTIRRDVPIYRAIHEHAGFRTADGATRPMAELQDRRWFAACAIGDPQTFLRQLQHSGGTCAGYRCFADHHHYTAADLADVRREARAAGADVVVTTEKDWAKLRALPPATADELPVWVVDVRIRFLDDGDVKLWEQVWNAVSNSGRNRP